MAIKLFIENFNFPYLIFLRPFFYKNPIIFVFLLFSLSGCKEFIAETPVSQVRVPSRFDSIPNSESHQIPSNMTEWWRSWNDPILSQAISSALTYNTDLRIAQARVIEARSGASIADGALLPTVGIWSGVGGGPANWYLPEGYEQSRSVDAYLAGITGNWEPDLFGGRADDAAAAHFTVINTEEQLQGTKLLITIELAQNYFAALNLIKRLMIIDKSITYYSKLENYFRERYNVGQVQLSDVSKIRTEIEVLRSKREPLDAEIKAYRRRVSVLSGGNPDDRKFSAIGTQFNLPKPPRGIIPSEVLERRPDVRARLAAVNSQLSRLNSAKKDLLPRFRISFFDGSGRLHFEGIPGLQGLAGLASISVYLPIFTAGRIEANISLNDAQLQRSLAEYDKVILKSLEEVENSYGEIVSLRSKLNNLNMALQNAIHTIEENNALYQVGKKTLGDVLFSRIEACNRANDLSQAQLEMNLATLRLYASLGGAW